MQVTPNEIDSIEEAGMLNGSPVKMIRTKGGFWICVGKPKGKYREEAIAAGSHPAIVKYNVEKQFPDFQPALMKSEYFIENTVVEKHSHFLSEDLRKSGHDVYSVQNGDQIEFHVTKHGLKVFCVEGYKNDKSVGLKKAQFPAEFARALAGAVIEKSVGVEK